MQLGKYSFGVGDRFGRQGEAQLAAVMKAKDAGVDITPVWNKSHREHTIIGTEPGDVRTEADSAVSTAGWNGSYFVDADHIGLSIVDSFIASSDFFTLDVADFTGTQASEQDIRSFMDRCRKYTGRLDIAGIDRELSVSEDDLAEIASKYLLAVQEAGRIYRRIGSAKGEGNFITEVSMDETDSPQTPVELFFILAAVSMEEIPADTIAPKFTGRFNKGVDYVGDVAAFEREFSEDLAVIAKSVKEFGLSDRLKLSIHSGSDKFSIYGPMRDAVKKADAGLHVKTAGTTWLEELIGLALAGGNGLKLAKEVYRSAHNRSEELCGPYASVIDIDPDSLPTPDEVDTYSGEAFASAVRHDQACDEYNQSFRQLLHVGYKVAAEMGERYYAALEDYKAVIAENVTENIFDRHISRLFLFTT